MGDGTREYHTFTFFTDQKATETLAQNALAPLPGTGKSGPPVMGIDPLAGLRSEPAGTALTDDGTTHGNGFVNTGLLDTDPKSSYPAQDTITFTKAGTYKFLCLLHPDMHGRGHRPVAALRSRAGLGGHEEDRDEHQRGAAVGEQAPAPELGVVLGAQLAAALEVARGELGRGASPAA